MNLNADQFAKHWEGDQSMEITAAAAAIAPAKGFSSIGGEGHASTASGLLDAIDSGPLTVNKLYSGHGGTHVVEDNHIELPLMAASSDPKVAEGFSGGGKGSTVYEFHSYRGLPVNDQETVVSGRYEVRDRKTGADGVERIGLSYRSPLQRKASK